LDPNSGLRQYLWDFFFQVTCDQDFGHLRMSDAGIERQGGTSAEQ
jgi:hypothetical protein